jgi:hypothetical protein
VYRVVGIEADNLRIVSDSGEPVLFNAKAFEFVEPTKPLTWIVDRGRNGEQYAYPHELRHPPDFFERFFDYDMEIRQKFHGYMHQLCHQESAASPPPPNVYVRVQLKVDSSRSSITQYVELDKEYCEVRKIEISPGGSLSYAWGKGSTGTTQLDDQFKSASGTIDEISREEFEAVWDRAIDVAEV